MPDRVNQRTTEANVDADLTTVDPVQIGDGSLHDALDAAVVGVDAEATHEDATAVGHSTTTYRQNQHAIGDRDLGFENSRGVVYPADQGIQNLVDLPIDGAPAGENHYITLSVAGENLIEHRAESDGAGGIQNARVYIPWDLVVEGNVTEVDETVTGVVTVEDGTGTEQFVIDGTAATPSMDFLGNILNGLSRINPDGDALEIDGDLSISGELTEGQAL